MCVHYDYVLWAGTPQPLVFWHNSIGNAYPALQELHNDTLIFNSEGFQFLIHREYGDNTYYTDIIWYKTWHKTLSRIPIYGYGQP